jgi:hypothetical protein
LVQIPGTHGSIPRRFAAFRHRRAAHERAVLVDGEPDVVSTDGRR